MLYVKVKLCVLFNYIIRRVNLANRELSLVGMIGKLIVPPAHEK